MSLRAFAHDMFAARSLSVLLPFLTVPHRFVCGSACAVVVTELATASPRIVRTEQATARTRTALAPDQEPHHGRVPAASIPSDGARLVGLGSINTTSPAGRAGDALS